jgi:hypothetical protein
VCQCENTTDREQPPGHNIGNFAHYARWRVGAITKAIHTCDLIILLYNCLLFLIFGPSAHAGGRRRQFVLLKMKQRAAPSTWIIAIIITSRCGGDHCRR